MRGATDFVVKNLHQFQKQMEKSNRKRIKAGQTATKVEAFRLRNVLKREIREGAPGGVPFSPLTELAKRTSGKGLRRKPLKRLAIGVRYRARKRKSDYIISLGFMGSKSWERIARFQQHGGTVPISDQFRKILKEIGAKLQKTRPSQAKFFFLRKGTKKFRVPGRPIIAPFWQAHREEAFRNIRRNYERKLRGERI